jgi:mannosyltransferase OCH1-like enzyme
MDSLILIIISIVILLSIVYFITSRSNLTGNKKIENALNSSTQDSLLNSKNVLPTNNIKTYKDLLNDYDSIKKTPGGIPKLIIKTSWQTLQNLPPQIDEVLKITIDLNPDYQLYYFDDEDIQTFMQSYGVAEYNAYKKLIPGAYKADLFRYCILYKYGGCYSDIGHVMLQSFDYIIGKSKLVIVKDKPEFNYTGIHNALICVEKNNGFIKRLIEKCVENIENDYYGENSLDVTGPVMMGKVFQCYYYNVKVICNSI